MTATHLRTLLASLIPARLAVLITGAPGIGKSDIVAQAAADAGADLILSHPVVDDPTDAKGMPWVIDGAATFLPFGELRRAIDATRPTVWFLDDLGQASAAVQASYMQLLLARRVNGHAISDHVTFCAATNRRTDRAGVSGILEPVKSRFTTIVELEADIDSWCGWAIDHDLPAELIAFLRFRPELLSQFVASADLVNSPTPRTWAHVARLMDLQLPSALQPLAFAGAVGAAATAELVAFLRLYAELPNIDQILIDPSAGRVPTSPSALYAVSAALAMRATVANFPRVATYAQRLVDDGRGEFGVLLLRDTIRREPGVTQSRAFVKLATSELGALLNGGR